MNLKKIIGGTLAMAALGGVLVFAQPAPLYAVESAANSEAPITQRMGIGLGRIYGSMIDTVSKLLGMEADQIRTERQAGKSLSQIAETKGVKEEQLVKTIIDTRKAQLNQGVKDGKITEEQAQYCQDNMDSRIKERVNNKSVGYGNRNGMGVGYGKRGQGRGNGMGGGMGMRGN